MGNTPETRVEQMLHQLAAIAKNEFENGAFFGFFETDESYMFKSYGSNQNLVNILVSAANQDADIEKAIIVASTYIMQSNLTK